MTAGTLVMTEATAAATLVTDARLVHDEGDGLRRGGRRHRACPPHQRRQPYRGPSSLTTEFFDSIDPKRTCQDRRSKLC